MKRVLLMLLFLFGTLSVGGVFATGEASHALRVGLTATFPNEQYRSVEEWRLYMERKLNRRVEFVRRDSYLETMDLLRLKKLDFAWICDYPYVYYKSQLRLLAVPVYQGTPHYRSYLIVPASDRQTTSIAQLRNKVFAYTDPYSNTGYLTPRYQLHELGENPARFFDKTFYTWSHRKVVEAVAAGLANGGAVSSHVWDTLAIVKPELTAETRIVSRSPKHGFAPFVSHAGVADEDFDNMQRMLLGMSDDEAGKALLRRLNLDGFIEGNARLYESVDKMMRAFSEL